MRRDVLRHANVRSDAGPFYSDAGNSSSLYRDYRHYATDIASESCGNNTADIFLLRQRNTQFISDTTFEFWSLRLPQWIFLTPEILTDLMVRLTSSSIIL